MNRATTSLTEEEVERRILAFARLADEGGTTDTDARKKAIADLDDAYWSRVEDLAVARARSKAGLAFSEEDRLLLDAGLLDRRVVMGAAPGLRTRLSKELNQPAPAHKCLYFSEWLVERHRQFTLMREADKVPEKEGENAAVSLESEKLAKMRKIRADIYTTLTPLMNNLPGITDTAIAAIATGRLDATLEKLIAQKRDGAGQEPSRQIARLEAIHRQFISKVIARCRTDKELHVVEGLSRIRTEIFRAIGRGVHEMPKTDGAGVASIASASGSRESADFMLTEIRLMRNLLNLGTLGARGRKCRSVLTEDKPRATKPQVDKILAHIEEVDTRLSLDHNVLIAPFSGRGFFEWDRDSIVVSLVPDQSVEQNVVTAAVSFKLMADTLHYNNELKERFHRVFSDEEFMQRFLEGYTGWVLGVGRGKRDAVSDQIYDFFCEHVGPPRSAPSLPVALRRMTPETREKHLEMCRRRIRAGSGSFDDYLNAGLLLWQAGDTIGATVYLKKAASADPANGHSLYSLGALLREGGADEEGARFFESCISNAPDTIWCVYSQEALESKRG